MLLDTRLLLWVARDARELSRAARSLVESSESEMLFSVVSLWEVAIKYGLGHSDIVEPNLLRRALLNHGYTELPLTSDHAVAVSSLPHIHKDPFDRILVAQALIEGIILLTSDPMVAKYPGSIRKV
jgi:PIN domain nuclease of toxin-antitoxin system